MHKFPDFNDSTFFKIFSEEGRDVVREILANPEMIKPNFMGWRQDFSIDPETTVHDNAGFAVVKAYMRQIENGVMSDMRAPLGDSLPMERGNAKSYTAPIAHFTTRHFHETKATMFDKRKRWEALADKYGEFDAELLLGYSERLQTFLDGANMTLTNMGEQLMTNGYVYYDEGVGVHAGIYKAEIPTENFLGACMYKMSGSSEVQTTWADTDALMIDSLRRLVEKVNAHLGVEWKWQLDVPKAVWDNYIKKNKQVQETMFLRANPGIIINNAVEASQRVMYFTDEQVAAMLAEQTGLPAIFVHDTTQKDAVKGIVHGWKTGIVTLRPLGHAGLIRHTDILDAEYFTDPNSNPAIKDYYTPALMGLGYVNNTIWPNGRDVEYRTRLIYSATPTLDEFLYHFILTSGTASDGDIFTA